LTHPLDPNVGEVLRSLARESLAKLDQERRARERVSEDALAYSARPTGYVTRLELIDMFHISLGTIQYYQRLRVFPYVRVGNNVFYDPDKIAEALPTLRRERGRRSK
jgi:hypothetical protein